MSNDASVAGMDAIRPGDVVRRAQGVRRIAVAAALVAAAAACPCASAVAQDAAFAPEEIATGARIFARNCSPCHGPHMRDPESAFDLRKFPHDAHDRFVSSVTRGKNQMPPWGDLLDAAEIESLWAYVMAGESK